MSPPSLSDELDPPMMIVARQTRSLGVESVGQSAGSLALLIGRETSNSRPQVGHLKSYSGIDVPSLSLEGPADFKHT